MARPLTPALREDFAAQSYAMSLKGFSNREISRQLGISDKTVAKLVRAEAMRRSEERRDYLQRAIDAHQQVIKRIWQVLDHRNPSDHALAQLAHAVTNAQSQLDKITGVIAPAKIEAKVALRQEDYISNFSDAVLEALELIHEAGAAGLDGEEALDEVMKRRQAGTLAPPFRVSNPGLLELVSPDDIHRVENLDELTAEEDEE